MHVVRVCEEAQAFYSNTVSAMQYWSHYRLFHECIDQKQCITYTPTTSCNLHHIHALFRPPERAVVCTVEPLNVFFLFLHSQLNDLSNINGTKRLNSVQWNWFMPKTLTWVFIRNVFLCDKWLGKSKKNTVFTFQNQSEPPSVVQLWSSKGTSNFTVIK